MLTGCGVLLVAEMMSQLALQRTFDHRFGELLILLANSKELT